MIDVKVKPRADDRFDIYLLIDGEPIMNSSQGYENIEDAHRVVYRCLASLAVWSKVVGVSPDFSVPEPIIMETTFRSGSKMTEQIR